MDTQREKENGWCASARQDVPIVPMVAQLEKLLCFCTKSSRAQNAENASRPVLAAGPAAPVGRSVHYIRELRRYVERKPKSHPLNEKIGKAQER